MVTESKIEKLIALAKKHELGELTVRYSETSSVTVKLPTPAAYTSQQPLPPETTTAPSPLATQSTVRAPMVGTVYLRPKPDQPEYVQKGQKVQKRRHLVPDRSHENV